MPYTFEWLPDLEGIKTQACCQFVQQFAFEWLPDLEGIKTLRIGKCPFRGTFEWLPDLEGIKTYKSQAWIEKNARFEYSVFIFS